MSEDYNAKPPKSRLAYKKVVDAIIEIEVSMASLRKDIQAGYRDDDSFNEIIQTRKSLDKLCEYLVKLPNRDG